MNALKIFTFEQNTIIRVITDTNGETLFVAKDVASALGYENTAQAVRTHCKHAKALNTLKVLLDSTLHSQTQLIPESDLYRLTMRSQLDSAARFQDWVCEEVLPDIRKTGSFTKVLSPAELIIHQGQCMLALEQEQLRLAQQQALLEAKTVTLADTLAETTATLESQIADLQIQHRNGIPLHHLSKSQAHQKYAKGLSEKVFHAFLAYAKIPTQEYTHLTEDGQSVVTFAYLNQGIQDAVTSGVFNSTQVSACYCESKEVNLRYRGQRDTWLSQ